MSSPSNFAKAEIKFKKLDDLPKGKVNTADEVMKAMAVLHKMIHAQAAAYGGKNSKLLPVGIAEGSLLQQIQKVVSDVTQEELDDLLEEGLDVELNRAYNQCTQLRKHFAARDDEKGMELLLQLLQSVNAAMELAHRG